MMETSSSKVLKAHATRELGERVVFNLEDVHQECEQYIERVQQQAREILATAQSEADQLREDTWKQAHDEGRREGLAVAHDELNRRVERLAEVEVSHQVQKILPAVKQAAELLALEREAWLQHWETATLELALSIAEKIIRREVASHPQVAVDTVRTTLELATGAAKIEVQLHPDDAKLLGKDRELFIQEASGCGEITVTENYQITRGGCIVQTQHGVIDAQLETQLDRIAAEMN